MPNGISIVQVLFAIYSIWLLDIAIVYRFFGGMETIFWVASVLVQHTLLLIYIGFLDTEKIEKKKERNS